MAAKEPATATPTRIKCRHCCTARRWNVPSVCRRCFGLFSRNAGTCSVCRVRRTSLVTILVAGCAATSSRASSRASRVALGSWWPYGCGGVRARRDLFSGSDKKHYKPRRPTATPGNWQSAMQSTSGASRRNAGALPSFAISPRTASLCSLNPKDPKWSLWMWTRAVWPGTGVSLGKRRRRCRRSALQSMPTGRGSRCSACLCSSISSGETQRGRSIWTSTTCWDWSPFGPFPFDTHYLICQIYFKRTRYGMQPAALFVILTLKESSLVV